MKILFIHFFLAIILLLVFPEKLLSDIITPNGTKIQFFRKGEKKSISKKELAEGIFSHDYGEPKCLDKIVFKPKKNDLNNNITFTISIYNSKNELIIRKENILNESLPLYPWISEEGENDGYIKNNDGIETSKIGNYFIVIDSIRNLEDGTSVTERIIDVNYSVHELMGD
jgi:hypothetical protein